MFLISDQDSFQPSFSFTHLLEGFLSRAFIMPLSFLAQFRFIFLKKQSLQIPALFQWRHHQRHFQSSPRKPHPICYLPLTFHSFIQTALTDQPIQNHRRYASGSSAASNCRVPNL